MQSIYDMNEKCLRLAAHKTRQPAEMHEIISYFNMGCEHMKKAELGTGIRKARTDKGYTQEVLAETSYSIY